MSAFVLAGGLHALCSLFAHQNLVVRTKTITVFASITGHVDFDWFRPPRGARDARLHRALLGLRADPSFLSGLIANSWGSVSETTGAAKESAEKLDNRRTFPGGALISLEVNA